jgi:NNP family nitrate/nitrite transporter-like MFS transporter
MLNDESVPQSILHLTWIAFFLIFVSWFNMAPFNTTLISTVGLTSSQIDILMICNVALTIPARIIIGYLVDHFGPKKVFIWLLLFTGLVSCQFALATVYEEFLISRLLMSISGAGFVAGIKMIGDWYPPKNMGTAQGIYAGWGNFGAAAAIFGLPFIAIIFPPETGWRIAAAFSGLLCIIWAIVYSIFIQDAPKKTDLTKSKFNGVIEVTSLKDVYLQALLWLPIYVAISVLIWKLSSQPGGIFSPFISFGIIVLIFSTYILKITLGMRPNLDRIKKGIPPEKRYEFTQIFILSLVYSLTFGAELAMVSMFPEYLQTTFSLSITYAGILASSYAFANLVTRPSGGWLADKFGRKRILVALIIGTIISFWSMASISEQWPIAMAICLTLCCSLFVQSGNGACFAMVPLIRKDLTGQMAGMAGAYGNVGAVFFLTALSMTNAQTFFKTISIFGILVLISLYFLKPFSEKPPGSTRG